MARLSAEELYAARVRSGRMGGRPRKPTADEAREATLARLLPKAIAVLEAKIEARDQDSWRAAIKLIEYGWGRPAEQVEVHTETPVEALTLDQLRALRAKLLADHPELARLTVVE